MSIRLNISEEVSTAIEDKSAVVALESTILTHGLVRPHNLDAAKQFCSTARQSGAVPATIGIIDGEVVVGMDDAQLQRICEDPEARKVSSRDLAATICGRHTGGTTVATTIMMAQLVGISFCATGGMGGVHRDAGSSFDISNDISQLASNQIGVVASGIKAILDIRKTLECLETNGIPVYGWQTDEMPAFYSRSSGLSCPYRFDNIVDMVESIDMHWNLFPGGILIANPPPADIAFAPDYLESMIQHALTSAKEQGIRGKAITPFLLNEIHNLSEGKSEQLNVQLVESNIRVAAEAAKVLCQTS